jgi:hypothetical protein
MSEIKFLSFEWNEGDIPFTFYDLCRVSQWPAFLMYKGCQDIQHNDITLNDTQHNDTRYNDLISTLSKSDTKHNVVLSDTCLLLCWVSLCWVTLCRLSLCWMSLGWVSWRPMGGYSLNFLQCSGTNKITDWGALAIKKPTWNITTCFWKGTPVIRTTVRCF